MNIHNHCSMKMKLFVMLMAFMMIGQSTFSQENKSKENKGNIGGFSSNSKWSEEDEKTLNEIFSVAARASLRKSTLFGKSYDYIKWQNWLKSLRPQNHWKPSSEQMKALNAINVTGGISYAGQGQVLIELYNDLKKLKEE